jgi:hypothetical protein
MGRKGRREGKNGRGSREGRRGEGRKRRGKREGKREGREEGEREEEEREEGRKDKDDRGNERKNEKHDSNQSIASSRLLGFEKRPAPPSPNALNHLLYPTLPQASPSSYPNPRLPTSHL